MNGMLAAGAPAAEVMTEYVRACRRLGHSVLEPAHLHAAYTAEEGMDLQALDDDHRTLSEALAAVEAALVLQEQAHRALAAAWRGAGAVAAVDHLVRHTETAATVVDGLRGSVAALDELRNRLWQLVEAKVDTTQGIEARGTRAEWLSAARTVTAGVGDRAGASEMVDMQVAPFVATDIALDWVSTMRDTESAIRQAYRDAAAAIASQASAVFERPGLSGAIPVAAETVSVASAPAAVVPTSFVAGPAAAGTVPAQSAVSMEAVPASTSTPTAPAAAPSVAPTTPVAADPMAAAAAPMPAATSPLGSGMSGLSGLGQSFSDMLGGLLGSGGGLGETLGAVGDLDPFSDDRTEGAELDDLGDPEPDEDEEDPDGEEPDEDEPLEGETPAEESAGPAEAEVPAEPVAVTPEPVVPTPVPEPLADPAVAAPAEPVPADTPCEIAADELPQAGP